MLMVESLFLRDFTLHVALGDSGGLRGAGERLDSKVFEGFSNQNNFIILESSPSSLWSCGFLGVWIIGISNPAQVLLMSEPKMMRTAFIDHKICFKSHSLMAHPHGSPGHLSPGFPRLHPFIHGQRWIPWALPFLLEMWNYGQTYHEALLLFITAGNNSQLCSTARSGEAAKFQQ